MRALMLPSVWPIAINANGRCCNDINYCLQDEYLLQQVCKPRCRPTDCAADGDCMNEANKDVCDWRGILRGNVQGLRHGRRLQAQRLWSLRRCWQWKLLLVPPSIICKSAVVTRIATVPSKQ